MLPLMAAILFPVFARAREKARQASCQSNLKQIALGVLMYTQDYDETHPMANNWSDALDPYLKNRQLFLCPSANDLTQRSYAYNQALEQEKMGAIPRPAETIMAFDSQPGANPVGGQELIVWRHNNGANFAFDDGHVKWIRSGVQTNLTWAPAGGAPAGLGGLPPPPWGAPPGMPPDMPGMPPGMPGAPK